MTRRKDLLRPLEPVECLAAAYRDALLIEMADYKTLVTTQRVALQQATDHQQERLQDCPDALGRPSQQIGSAGATGLRSIWS